MRFTPRHFSPRHSLVFLLMVLAPSVFGCGGGKGTVSGTVTLDDQPLAVGTIAFQPAKGNAVSAPIKDGKYTVEGVPAGEAKVTVDTKAFEQQMKPQDPGMQQGARQGMTPPPGMKMPPEAQKYFEERKQASQANEEAAKELRKNFRKVPDKYSKADTSGLTFKVQSGKGNTFDVPLKSQ